MTGYRYTLTRDVDQLFAGGTICWVMLNPSRADDLVDDPTIRRCIRFTRDHGYADMEVVNLFAARATMPTELAKIDDPVGRNDAATLDAISAAQDVVFAWGTFPDSSRHGVHRLAATRADFVKHCCRQTGVTALCLGQTADGSPRHPLYVPAAERFRRFEARP